ncbi:MAG: FAD-dependent oxidoreductase [Chitinophagaceae bacterium]
MRNFFFLFIVFHFLFFALSAQQVYNTQVLVVGGSTGGTAAGIQCARLGIQTIIVEQTNWLGGMLTAAGVSCTDGNDELPGGMWQEFREALYAHYGTRNLFTGWVSETCFEPSVGDSIFKAWSAKEKSLSVLYGWYFDKVLKTANKVTGAIFINKSGEQLIVHAKLTIDGTDLGDVFADAGAAFDIGMESKEYSKEKMAPGKNNIIQDITLAAVLKDYGKGVDVTIARPQGYDSTLYFCCCTDAPCIKGNPYKVDAQKMLDYGKLPNDKYMINWPAHGNDSYINVINLKPIEREKVLQSAKNKTLGFVYFIQTVLGYKNLGLADEFSTNDKLPFIPYHREGRRIKGVIRLNANHLIKPFSQAKKLYRTGISVGDYPVDHHHAPEKNAPVINFPKVPSFNVPLGALIPGKLEGLIVCEKGISVSNIVNGSTRLQPCVLLTGQAGGILAALCILQQKNPRQLSVRDVQKELLKQKSYIMPYVDVKPSDSGWEAIQRIGATGILKGIGKPEGWANKTFFYPDSTITERELALGLFEFEKDFPKQKYFTEKKLTFRKSWDMIVEMQHHIPLQSGIGHKFTPIIADEWQQVAKDLSGGEKIEGTRLITRKQLAVLINRLSENVFEQKINLNGGRVE